MENIIGLLWQVAVIVGFPVAWFVSELLSGRRFIRCALGGLAILSIAATLTCQNMLLQIDYNLTYSKAARELIEATVKKLEAGQPEVVLQEFKVLEERFPLTYEDSHFDEFAAEAAKRILAGGSGSAANKGDSGQSIQAK